jgi:hypothetical protein
MSGNSNQTFLGGVTAVGMVGVPYTFGQEEAWAEAQASTKSASSKAMLDHECVRKAAEEYLKSRPFTLWGPYDLSNPERFTQAVDWLVTQVMEINARVTEEFKLRKKAKK